MKMNIQYKNIKGKSPTGFSFFFAPQGKGGVLVTEDPFLIN
jgi:hypothetical protein